MHILLPTFKNRKTSFKIFFKPDFIFLHSSSADIKQKHFTFYLLGIRETPGGEKFYYVVSL